MGLFEKFNKGLRKTRNSMSGAIDVMLHGKNEIDEDLYEELEEILVLSDIGVNTATEICDILRKKIKEQGIKEYLTTKLLQIKLMVFLHITPNIRL